MSKVEQLEHEVAQLPATEYAEFSAWMVRRLADEWDGEIEADASAGKLDFLVREAKTAYNGAELREWPGKRA